MKKIIYTFIMLAIAQILLGQHSIPYFENFESAGNYLDFPVGWEVQGMSISYGESHFTTRFDLTGELSTKNPYYQATTPEIGPIVSGTALNLYWKFPLRNVIPNFMFNSYINFNVISEGSSETIYTLRHTHTLITDTDWSIVDLTPYTGKIVKIQFEGFWMENEYDAFSVIEMKELVIDIKRNFDLDAITLLNHQIPIVGQSTEFTLYARNLGDNLPTPYEVKIMQVAEGGDIQIACISNSDTPMIQFNETRKVYLSWIPNKSGEIQLYGLIDFPDDENLVNNATEKLTLNVLPENVGAVSYVGSIDTGFAVPIAPFNFFNRHTVSQSIYNHIQINKFGSIHKISYLFNGNGDIDEDIPISIYMGTTVEDDYITSRRFIPKGDFQLVFNGVLPVKEKRLYMIEIDLDSPFHYYRDNLVIMTYKTISSSGKVYNRLNQWLWSPSLGSNTLLYISDETAPDINNIADVTASYTVSLSPNIAFYFSEGYSNESDISVNPVKSELIGNYPNPFNPTTTIKFKIEKNALETGNNGHGSITAVQHVRLDIYNIRGQRVKTLINGDFTHGEHSVVWNGLDDNAQSVGSGIYFYKFTSGDVSHVKKMLMIK